MKSQGVNLAFCFLKGIFDSIGIANSFTIAMDSSIKEKRLSITDFSISPLDFCLIKPLRPFKYFKHHFLTFICNKTCQKSN